MRSKFNNPVLSLGLVLATVFTACSATQHEQKIDLTVQLSGEPVTLDPSLAEDGLSLKILANLMDGLVAHDATGTLRLRLAEKYEVSERKKKVFYEFLIRKDAFWSDGTPVMATDFQNAILRSLDKSTPSKLSHQLFLIKNARAFKLGKVAADEVGIVAHGKILRFELEFPSAVFLEVLTLPVALPQRPGNVPYSIRDGAPTSGMYTLTKYVRDQAMILTKNPKHPQWEGLPANTPEVVKLQIVQDDTTAAHLFEKKTVDILTRVATVDTERFKAKSWLKYDPFLATYYIGFNTLKSPVNDIRVRKAIVGAIHKAELVQSMGTGELPADSWIPTGLEGYVPHSGAHESDATRDLGKSFINKNQKISLAFDSSSRNSLIVEKIQADVKKKLGIKLELVNYDWKSFIGVLTHDAPQMFRFGWLAPFMDPITHLMVFTTGDPNNYTGWSNAEYDRLVKEVSQMSRGPQREKRIQQAQAILVDEHAVIIPLFHYIQTHAVSPRVTDFKVSPYGVIRFDELRVAK